MLLNYDSLSDTMVHRWAPESMPLSCWMDDGYHCDTSEMLSMSTSSRAECHQLQLHRHILPRKWQNNLKVTVTSKFILSLCNNETFISFTTSIAIIHQFSLYSYQTIWVLISYIFLFSWLFLTFENSFTSNFITFFPTVTN